MALVALSVGGAMGQYLESLVTAISRNTEVHFFVPEHYKGDTGAAIVHKFQTGSTRKSAFARLVNPFLGRSLWKSIVGVNPDLIHLFNGEGYPWAILFSYWATRSAVPFIITLHDPVPHPGNILERLNSWLRIISLRNTDAVHIHANVYRNLISLMAPNAHIFVVPHGSLAPRFLKYAIPGVKRKEIVFFFGRLEAYKGIDLLVQAGELLEDKTKIIIAGPGRLSKEITDVILAHPERYELHDRYLQDNEVAALFQKAKVCVLPYRQASQSSLPLIAAAFGVPVVATAVGAFVDDVPRVNGTLIPTGDAESLARAIQGADKMISCYPKELEFDVLVDRFIEMYNSVLTSSNYTKEVR